MDEDKPIVWRGRDLSTPDAIARYHGRCHVQSVGRGAVLCDLELKPQLDEILDTGDYEIEIRVLRRLRDQRS